MSKRKAQPAYCGCKDKHGKVKPARYDIFCSLRCAADRGVAETEHVSYCERHGWRDNTSCYHCIQEQQSAKESAGGSVGAVPGRPQ